MGGEMILELTSADISGALEAITKAGVEIREVFVSGDLSVKMRIHRKDYDIVCQVTERRGETVKQILRLGTYWKFQKLARHWVLLLGILFLLILNTWLPTRVFFLQVAGNVSVPTRLILEKAAQCGITFGADRGTVRSEQMKNSLLDALPQLQWAGVNTYGCVAVITVEERQISDDDILNIPGNIVALRDGIITSLTAERGTAIGKPGQAVRKGEVLISGYTDCGGVILLQGAKGEVFGQTRHQISAKTAEKCFARVSETGTRTSFSLIIGKNRINFYEDSGILDTGCVKMYSEYYMTLPGGLTLPVKLVRETVIQYEWTEQTVEPAQAETILTEQTAAYLESRMIAGQILSEFGTVWGYSRNGDYICREMIGRSVYEEITKDYGEDH